MDITPRAHMADDGRLTTDLSITSVDDQLLSMAQLTRLRSQALIDAAHSPMPPSPPRRRAARGRCELLRCRP